jgi:predicted unusual protein kinase regulating ubiquinone biosynthesis (AarF/ABC1/UbiB family)/DNA-binding XRE family transcriptional regulator
MDSNRLLNLRESLGMSQRELADEFQVTSGAIAHWEAGTRPIPGPVLRLVQLYEAELPIVARPDRARPAALEGTWRRHPPTAASIALWLAARGFLGPLDDNPVARRARLAACRHLVRTLGKHRGLGMKLGQLIGYLTPHLDEAEGALFADLRRTATPMPPAAVVGQIVRSFGRTPRQLFAAWSPQPFAVGSIGQVHAATTQDGLAVAVKVQPPRMKQALQADVRPLALLERAAAVLFPGQRTGALLAELRARLEEETDYALEAEHQRRFAACYADHDSIHVPRVVDALSAGEVITTELVRGRALAEFAASASRVECDRAGEAIWRFYFESALRDGRYNTDPQPDNLVFEEGGRVAFLDFGRVHVLSAAFVDAWRRLLRAVLERDRDRMVRILCQMDALPDPPRFDRDVGYRAMVQAYRMCLVDEPFEYDHSLVRSMWAVAFARNANFGKINYTPEMLFFPQLAFGVSTVLARLGARVRCRPILLDVLYQDGETRPPPFSPAELAALLP